MTVFDIEVAKRFKDLDPYQHSPQLGGDRLHHGGRACAVYRQWALSARSVIGQVVARQEIDYRRPI
jgi:hypothetical protein